MNKLILFIPILLVIMFFFTNSSFYLSDVIWKYSRGINVGDTINYQEFDDKILYVSFYKYMIVIDQDFN